jgi:hypothetical protein
VVATLPEKSRLADGCYHVFIDVGANVGVHTRFLYEPERYPLSDLAVSHFRAHFGDRRDKRDLCAFAFEPNPAHKERHLQLQSAYKAMGWMYYPIFAGVSDQAGNLTFWHLNDTDYKEWGFNAFRSDSRWGKGVPETVPIVRLADFLLEDIRDRAMPSNVYGVYPQGPKVVMKMDTEGMEYVTLPDLLASGALCTTVDFCFGEFHGQDAFFPMNRTETHGGLYLKDGKEALEFGSQLIRTMNSAQNCKTNYSTFDDESYLRDRIPLPSPTKE